MNKELMLRTAALQLQATDSKEVVKVASIVRNLQHWLKKVIDPEYRALISKMDTDTQGVQNFISELDKELKKIRLAIRAGDLIAYNKSLSAARALSLGFWSKIKEVSQEAGAVSKIIKGYTRDDIGQQDFKNKFKQHLPAEYDLDVNSKKNYNVPLKSVGWYKSLTPDMIMVNGGTITVAVHSVQRKLGKILSADKLQFTGPRLDLLLDNIREAIINGTLISVSHRKHSPKMNVVQWGTTEIEVVSAPFEIPDTGVTMSLVTTLEDPRTARTRSPNDKLMWVTSNLPKIVNLKNITITPQSTTIEASRKKILEKLAFSQESPMKYTSLNDVELAQVLRAGYRLAFGSDPTAQVLAGGWAQTVLESGRPIKLPNNNIGNIKATNDWLKSGKSYFVKSTSEFTKDGKGYIDQNAKWRAYASPQDGAAGYWELIGNRYKNSMDWMAAGDPNSATVSLAMNHYFTANIEKYAKGVSNLYQEFMIKIAPQIPNLLSAVASPPGEKLLLKPWLKDYHEKPNQIDAVKNQPSEQIKEVDSLMQTLYSETGPMQKFVKEALLQQLLPSTNFVILLQSEASIIDKMEYAKVTSNILKKFLEVKANVHSDGLEVEIQGVTLGKPLTVTASIQAVCDCLSDAMNMSASVVINALVVPGFISKYGHVEMQDINKNSRLFQLKRMS